MKTEEDEAFDELARKQGAWGGGFKAKQAMAADKLQEPPSEWEGIKAILDEYGLQAIDFVADFKAALALPAQEQRPWVGLTDEEIRDCLGPEAVRIPPGWSRLTRAIEAKLKEKNNG